MITMKTEKDILRRQTLAARDQLTLPFREEASGLLAAQIDFFGDVSGKVVSGFWPIRSEIDPRPLMSLLKDRGARLVLPVVMDKITIEFRSYETDDDLVDAGFDTRGPGPEAPVLDPDIMLVPLSVFDRTGGRIGYGAGFYDRAIARLVERGAQPVTVGIAFAMQEVSEVPQDHHDIRLDRFMTPSGVITPEPKGAC